VPFEIHNWAEISENYTGALLLGNGASISVNNRFAYNSLIQHARDNGLLTQDVQQLFGFFNTSDFELVLRLVWQASHVNRSLNIPDERTHDAYLRVRECLIQSVRNVHPEHGDVAGQLPAIYAFLKGFKTALSLNYDLILYWAIMYGLEIPDRHSLKDCFVNGSFDENWRRFRTPIYGDRSTTLAFYPHGSLILCRDIVESERKINSNGNDLLNSILQVWQTESYIPIFVSEGVSQQKINSIQNSYYLSTVYREVLTTLEHDLTIYGWGFGEHDLHILRRMAAAGIQRVAVSVYGADQAFCNRAWQIIQDTLGRHVQVVFFNSESRGCWNHVA
jgi:hypothetical protein